MPVSNTISNADSKLKSKQGSSSAKLGAQQMVHWFVASSYASGSFTEERVQNSVDLLHQVPAARHAVLHRFTLLFEEAIRVQLDQIEYQASGVSPEITSSLDLVFSTLIDLLHTNGEAWASILCTWSVESLGQISSCYKLRQVVPSPSNLPKLLVFWLNIVAMRMLLDIYRTCLKILTTCSQESCLDSLLTISSSHSPFFDWVVADIGNAFPEAVIERVLFSGFSKFCKLRWTASLGMTPSGTITMNENEQTILTSVIRILEHLMSQHKNLICNKMLDMFKNPVDKEVGQIKSTVFLMTLFSMSCPLLQATTQLFVNEIKAHTLNNLYKEFQKISKGTEDVDSLCSLVVHLVCQSGPGSYKLMALIFDGASRNRPENLHSLDAGVVDLFSKILPSLLNDLQHLAQSDRSKTQNALSELSENYQGLCKSILSDASSDRRMWLNSLLLSVCLNRQANKVLSLLLVESTSASDLEIFLKLYDEVQPLTPELLENVVKKAFCTLKNMPDEKRINFLRNIYYLISQSGSGLVSDSFMTRLKRSLCFVVDDMISMLASLASPVELSSIVIQLLFLLLSSVSSSKFRLKMRLLPLTRNVVFYFFKLLHSGHVNNDQVMQSCHRALVELSQTHELFEVVCRFLLEASVTKENSLLFGKCIEPDFDEDPCLDQCVDRYESLLAKHRKLSAKAISRRTVGGFVPISVETGLVGSGPKRRKTCPKSKAAQTSNNECLSLLIYRCCCKTSGGADVSQLCIPDVAHAFDADKLSLLSDCLVSSVTAASPYLATTITLDGDLEWPPCHMRKYTIERDLKVFHFLDEHPFVWQMLYLVAHNYRAFWNLSPILRSCVSVLLSHFESSRLNGQLNRSSIHYVFAMRVVQVAGKGQLLPSPLCYVSELFHAISEYEIFILLSMVWNFIKDHPPPLDIESSSKIQRDFSAERINQQSYLTSVHTVLHANIVKLGYLFSRFKVSQ